MKELINVLFTIKNKGESIGEDMLFALFWAFVLIGTILSIAYLFIN